MGETQTSSILPGGIPLIIITGMSGAGKLSAMRVLEDMGCFCADNLPPSIIPTFFHLCKQSRKQNRIANAGVVIVSDIRSGAPLEDFQDTMKTLNADHVGHQLIYLDCNTDTLIRRFKEVRRAPPLQSAGIPMEAAIEEERRRLSPIREMATRIIDTSDLSLQEFRKLLVSDIMTVDFADSVVVHVASFGFKYGLPKDIDFAFDVRFLPNPFYNLEMKHKTGQDKDVFEFVMKPPLADQFFHRAADLVSSTLDAFLDKGKNHIVVGIGCTGGRHRSVAFAIRLHEHFLRNGIRAELSHRDIAKPQQ